MKIKSIEMLEPKHIPETFILTRVGITNLADQMRNWDNCVVRNWWLFKLVPHEAIQD